MKAIQLTFLNIALVAISQLSIAQTAEYIEPNLSADELELVDWLVNEEQNMVQLLERLTNINSGSLNKPGVDAITAIFREEFGTLGFANSLLPGDRVEMPSCPGSDYSIDVTDQYPFVSSPMSPFSKS